LALEGRRVLVLEPGGDRGQAWLAAAGMLAPQIETDYFEPLYELGVAGRERYVPLAAELRETTGIDIGLWREGIARVAGDDAEADALRANVAHQRQQGHRCDWLDAGEVHDRWPWVRPVEGALWAPHDGALDPAQLVRALLADAARRGAVIVPAAAQAIRRTGDRVTSVVAGDTFHADDVIVAAGAWSARIEGLPRPLSVEPVRGQMAALPWPAEMRRAILYHRDCYIVARGSEALLGSTMEYAGFDASVTDAGQQRVWAGVRTLCPDFASLRPSRTWAGLRPVTPDGLPILGAAPDVSHLWYACGHGRNGILLAGISALLLHQMIKGEPVHEHVKAFSPSRMWQW
jgi:glycine oxidase